MRERGSVCTSQGEGGDSEKQMQRKEKTNLQKIRRRSKMER